jgi:transposase
VLRANLDSLEDTIERAFRPPNATDLNPVELSWAWLKRQAMAEYSPDSIAELVRTAPDRLKSAQRRTPPTTVFSKRAELF